MRYNIILAAASRIIILLGGYNLFRPNTVARERGVHERVLRFGNRTIIICGGDGGGGEKKTEIVTPGIQLGMGTRDPVAAVVGSRLR